MKIIPTFKVVKRRGLRAGWTIEISEDIMAIHSLDAEKYLVEAIAAEIKEEVE